MRRLATVLLPTFAWFCAGCGGGDQAEVEADLKKPTSDIRASAQQMENDALEKRAKAFGDALEGKRVELDAVVAKMKGMKPSEILGTEGARLTKDMAALEKDVRALAER
ncbi:MAG: hypothetical protein HYY93_09755, partial [Planctomycetes bacterium]|nr:hypothetical protein [Planctomycetota bacterium]